MKVFVCHASSDKDRIARPLAAALSQLGYKVWYDEYTLHVGDKLLATIDNGLSTCDYGVVILSPGFFAAKWALLELGGLSAREVVSGRKVILPVWDGVDHEDVARHSPILANVLAARMSEGLQRVVEKIDDAIQASANQPPSPASLTYSLLEVAVESLPDSATIPVEALRWVSSIRQDMSPREQHFARRYVGELGDTSIDLARALIQTGDAVAREKAALLLALTPENRALEFLRSVTRTFMFPEMLEVLKALAASSSKLLARLLAEETDHTRATLYANTMVAIGSTAIPAILEAQRHAPESAIRDLLRILDRMADTTVFQEAAIHALNDVVSQGGYPPRARLLARNLLVKKARSPRRSAGLRPRLSATSRRALSAQSEPTSSSKRTPLDPDVLRTIRSSRRKGQLRTTRDLARELGVTPAAIRRRAKSRNIIARFSTPTLYFTVEQADRIKLILRSTRKKRRKPAE